MPISVKITTTGMNSAVSAMLKLQSPIIRKIAIETGSIDAIESLSQYYNLGGSRLWENPSLPTHGAGRRKTQWWRHIPNSWTPISASSNGVTLRSKGAIGFLKKPLKYPDLVEWVRKHIPPESQPHSG